MTTEPAPVIVDLPVDQRDGAIQVLMESFEGVYRWHAKRTLRHIATVRAAKIEEEVAGIAMLERLTPEVGYVYYVAVGRDHRHRGLGGLLLDDALARFRAEGATVVYAAAEEDNTSSLALFKSRGFRTVERKELSYQYGGLGAWGLRSRMMLVSGEVLLGLRIGPGPPDPDRLPIPHAQRADDRSPERS